VGPGTISLALDAAGRPHISFEGQSNSRNERRYEERAKRMKLWQTALTAIGIVLLVSAAEAQTNVRIRGTITAIEGNLLSVKSRDGRDLLLQLADNLTVAVAKAARFEDIKPGDYLGSATKPGPDGTLVALEVHYLAPTVAEGQTPWDLAPDSTMTNARVGAVQSAGRRELTLQYKDGAQRILVPEDAPIVRAVPGTRADLVVGEYVFIAAQAAPDGALSAARIPVSKDGVKPPQ
jgi:hypothetical protein